ncbi:MAG TPA: hypothetical protein VL326_27880 [Kofleriaceae bacterium]|jgi:hypothetical protein|nr:hypothetical protein [Kofleriaceae bacterium]
MGRLEDIVERNKNPRKHRQGRFPFGIAVSALVLLVLVLMIFTDLGKPNVPAKPAETPAPEEKGRVHDIGIYVEHSHRDAGVVTAD